MTLYLALFYLNPYGTTHYSNIVSKNLTTTFHKLFYYSIILSFCCVRQKKVFANQIWKI